MNKNIYIEAIENSDCAFAYHKAVFDDNNKMIDYIFLDVNKSFEKETGLKKENIINKRFVRDIALNEEYARAWVDIYEKVIIDKKMIEFEDYSKEYNKHFKIKAYYSEENCFITLFTDKTFEKKIQEIAKYFSENMGEDVDYKKIVQLAHEITGAEVSAFNLFDDDGKNFTTVSVFAESKVIENGLRLMNQKIVGRKWAYDPAREALTAGRAITHFESLDKLTGRTISKEVVKQLITAFQLGEVVVAKIEKDGKVLGDFTLLFTKDERLENQGLLKLYLSQLGLFIEKTRILQSLKESQKRFYSLAEYAPVGFVSSNTNGEITYANKRLLEIIDSPSYEKTAKINLLEFPKLIKSGFSEKLKECIDNDREIIFEMSYESTWGRHIWVKVYLTPNKENGRVIGANIIVDDITERKEVEEELKDKVERDPLTKAYNRRAIDTILSDRLEDARDNKLSSCLAVLDVDDFKEINDEHGHRAGDKVLKYIASRIKKELREKDLIIRTGGDEFLIYLHDIREPKDALKSMDRIFNKITGKYRLDDDLGERSKTIYIRSSIGVSFYPKDGEEVIELMAKADKSLYEVKRSGKANYDTDL
ncbi:diguanylate cyclase [Gudongella sp. DL1XJH-153]|uniref:diguanylate cyclase n=1 Tax=Gudongella sp. DL1XJH-153 TaxID=3409804 RepID=UPI003BB7D5E7